MKKLVVFILLGYCINSEAQNYNNNNYNNSNGYDPSFWFQQPQQPVLNYQFNTVYSSSGNNGNYNNYNSYNNNFVARDFGRSLGNLIISIQNNKRRKRNRNRNRNRNYNNNRCNSHNSRSCCN